MNIYDFDGTIYDGDSSVDFFWFCLKRNWRCLGMLPDLLGAVGLYLLKRHSKEQMKTAFFRFVSYFDNIEDVVSDFWMQHEKKIKDFYIRQKQENDVIISASPVFLLQPVCERLSVKLIATKVDSQTGEVLGKNCHGVEKVLRLRAETDEPCEEFYSDSYSDRPLAELAQQAFLVKGDTITSWK